VDCAGAGGGAVIWLRDGGCQAPLNPPVEACNQNQDGGNVEHRSPQFQGMATVVAKG
jgi:hypothetical protein